MASRQSPSSVHDGSSGASRRQIARAFAALVTGNLSLFQIGNGRAIEHAAQGVKARAVTRAIPGFFASVPSHDAPQMRTYGRKGVQVSVLVAIHRGLFQAVAQYGTFTGLDLVHRFG